MNKPELTTYEQLSLKLQYMVVMQLSVLVTPLLDENDLKLQTDLTTSLAEELQGAGVE